MSEFHLPATVSERPDAARHGRPPGRGMRRQAGMRGYHLYIALAPASSMAFLGVVAVVDVIAVGTTSAAGRLILVAIVVVAVVVLGAAVLGADTATRRERRAYGRPYSSRGDDVQRRLGELAFVVSRGRQELQGLHDRVAAGETAPPRGTDAQPIPGDDAFTQLVNELRVAQNEAWNAVISAAKTRGPDGRTAQRVEVFVNLARRMQTLSHRAIQGLDELENQVEDPDLLKGLFRVDHLSTRMRRQAESLAVIGGAASRRQWSRPVTVYEVLRSAIAEVEHYNRVKVVPPVEGTLEGSAVADVIHLLAELIENATKFAPPHTTVLIRAEQVTAGLAIEVEDRGLGIPRDSQRRMNDLLADLDRIDVDELVQDGRIGLLVVSALSRRHSIAVQLNTNLYGGTQAVVVVPSELIGSEEEANAPAETAPVPVTAALPVGAPNSLSSSAPVTASAPAAQAAPMPAAPAAHAAPPPPPVGREAAAHRSDRSAGSLWSDPGTTPRSGLDTQASGERRPELPRRRAQTNLAPELLNAPGPREDDDTDAGHNPGLMAAFQQGLRSAQEDVDPKDQLGGTG